MGTIDEADRKIRYNAPITLTYLVVVKIHFNMRYR